MANAKLSIGIDLGGTMVKGLLVSQTGQILYNKTLYIPGDQWKETVANLVQEISAQIPGEHLLGISAPGIPSQDHRCIAYMPGRLQGLEGFNWSEMFGRSTLVVNDAIAALAAESLFGAARRFRHAILLTLGTGVGGAILIDGKIYQGAFQKAGHLGHITLNHAGDPDITGMPGSLEDAIGNCTIEQRTAGRFNSTHGLLEAVKFNDPFAKHVWMESIRKLAVGIASLTNVLSPEAVIIAGGITEAGDELFSPLRTYLDLYEWKAGGNGTQLIKADFGNLAGAMGAAAFSFMNQTNDRA